MNDFVLDASVALAWLIDRTVAPYAGRVRQLLLAGRRAIVPAIWPLEVANGFVSAERRGLLIPSDTALILRTFEGMHARWIEIRNELTPIRRAVNSARESGLTAYDAAYLDLAREQQVPLATLDRNLAKAAAKAGVTLIA